MNKITFALAILGFTSTTAIAQNASLASEEALLQQQIDNLRQQLIQQNQLLHNLQSQLVIRQQVPTTSVDTGTRASGERKSPAPSRSTEDLLIEQHNVFDRKLSLELGFSYAYYDHKQLLLRGLTFADAIFLGKIDTDRIRSHQWTMDLTGRYTFNDRWQAELKIPYIYRYMDYTATDEDSNDNLKVFDSLAGGNIGDISAAVYYRLLTETSSRPDLVWNFRVTAPTGRDPYGIPNTPNNPSNLQDVPSELATGSGLWGLSTGFSAVKTVDPAILFTSINYNHYLKGSFDDVSAGPTKDPGEVKLGDSFGYGLGMAFALSERLSLSLSFNQSFNFEAKQSSNGSDLKKITGTSGNSATMGMGVTWAIDENLSMVVNWASGLTPDAPDYVVSVRFPYRF
ncbi:MAG: transporter [Oceanisphaera sp.]|uniref:transporter n=1 Tax=Oceanisphaera sp. TaxID=1929979 RepID=UPI003F958630